jgi:hypothetical protein
VTKLISHFSLSVIVSVLSAGDPPDIIYFEDSGKPNFGRFSEKGEKYASFDAGSTHAQERYSSLSKRSSPTLTK